jgi:hypothetical protein
VIILGERHPSSQSSCSSISMKPGLTGFPGAHQGVLGLPPLGTRPYFVANSRSVTEVIAKYIVVQGTEPSGRRELEGIRVIVRSGDGGSAVAGRLEEAHLGSFSVLCDAVTVLGCFRRDR